MQLNDITYCRASSDTELNQILRLQKRNLPNSISIQEKQIEGFVTVDHTFEILKQMNDFCPHVIAKHENEVVGYTLCMHPNFANDIDVLRPMFEEVKTVLSDKIKFMVMGQVCVDKPYRQKGIFRGLYTFMRQELKPLFELIITEVDAENIRSLNAHKAIGFQILKEYQDLNRNWVIVGLNC